MKNDNTIEIYIHIPFCKQKCRYCDFLSSFQSEETIASYIGAIIKEIKCSRYSKSKVSTIFIGGGTPSYINEKYISQIMETLNEVFDIQENAEITIECNPGTITNEKAKTYINSGINRISMGLQSIDDNELQKLGRIYSWSDFQESYSIIRNALFTNINIDIMSGLPLQTIDRWRNTLKTVCRLNPEHISAYSLIIEENTPFYKLYNQTDGTHLAELPDEDTERNEYYLAKSILSDNGYKQYEISNYAKEGYECSHNIGYWIRKSYLGFGIGAASLINEMRYSNTTDMKLYLAHSESDNIHEHLHNLSVEEQMEECMYLGLRMIEGVDKSEFKEHFNLDICDIYGKVIQKYMNLNMIDCKENRLFLTKRGIDVSNCILADFLLD